MSAVNGLSYGSYNRTESFSGTISGGFQASSLIGKDVVDPEGNTVGEVEDLLIDPGDTVSSALLGVGGFLGIGSRQIAVELDQMTVSEDGLQTSMTEQELENMPAYRKNENGWELVESEENTMAK